MWVSFGGRFGLLPSYMFIRGTNFPTTTFRDERTDLSRWCRFVNDGEMVRVGYLTAFFMLIVQSCATPTARNTTIHEE